MVLLGILEVYYQFEGRANFFSEYRMNGGVLSMYNRGKECGLNKTSIGFKEAILFYNLTYYWDFTIKKILQLSSARKFICDMF